MKILFIFILFFFNYSNLFAQDKKKVLILHSYHESYKWTDDINKGIKSVITTKNSNIDIFIEYMDTKRFIQKEYYENLIKIYKDKYQFTNLDIIIASDNNAFNFLKKYSKTIFSDTPIIVCGINNLKKEDIHHLANFKGVGEKADIKRNFDLILRIHPNTKNIYLITDTTTTGKEIKKNAKSAIAKYPNKKINFVITDNVTVKELTSIVKNIPNNSAILFSVFFRDKNSEFFEYNDIPKIIDLNTKAPLYGLWDFSLDSGIIGGFLTSGYFQGRTAALMAEKVLKGKSFEKLQNMYRSPNQYMFDFEKLDKYKIDTKDLPKSSYIINKKETFYDLYKKEIFFFIFILSSMVIFIITLLINIKKRQEAEEKIKKQLTFQQELIDNVDTPIYYKDKNKIFIVCNKAYENLIDKKRDQIIGKSSYEIFNKEEADVFVQKDNEILETGIPQRYETSYKFDNKDTIDVIFYKKVFYDEYEIAGIVGAIFDITERKKVLRDLDTLNKNLEEKVEIRTAELQKSNNELIEQKNLIQILINSIPDLVWLKDVNGIYLHCNKRFSECYGAPEEEIIGKSDYEFIPEDVADLFRMHDKKAIEADTPLLNFEVIPFADGHEEYTQTVKTKIVDNSGKIIGVLGIGRDFTREQEQKDELEEFNEELQTTIDNLKRTKEQLVKSEKMASLGSLVAGVAHEINTPVGIGLTGITHFLEEVINIQKAYHKEEMSEEKFLNFLNDTKNIATLIRTNLDKTAHLIRSFKQVAVDQTNDQAREINIKEYISEVIFSISNITKQTNLSIELNCDDSINIITYPGSISQIITNLIINSIKHGFPNNEEGTIKINVSNVDDQIKIDYKDNGVGISENNLDKIFDPFFTTNRENGGTGLGLNIIYNIVTNVLQGSIECKSNENFGVQFILIFNREIKV